MEIKIRHMAEANGQYFTTCHHSELGEVIDFIKRAGGVFACGNDSEPFHSYQIVLDETGAWVEILVGERDE